MKRLLIITITAILLVLIYTNFSKTDNFLDSNNQNEDNPNNIDSSDKYNYFNFSNEEKEFIEKNNIDLDNLVNYYHYKSFDLYKYFEYEEARKENMSYLEVINIVNNPTYYSNYEDKESAIFLNSSVVLINKHYYIEKSYKPNNLVALKDYKINYIIRDDEIMQASLVALEHLEEMFNDALKDNLNLYVFSAYRNYQKQEYLYYVVNNQNDDYSARPGHSEHHSGFAFDISTLDIGLTVDFANSKEYNWLINNCYRYGFILRYPKDKENITLYKFEPWHFRYVGKTIALNIYENNLTLEEYILKNYEL